MAKKKNEDNKNLSSQNQLENFLKNNKEYHYNFEEGVYFEVTQGSLLLDLHVGKITPGIIRHTGISRGGKSSQLLEDVKNFLKEVDNSKAFWVLAEGRLSKKMKERSGLKFTTNPQEWEDGTVFIFESNVYETVFDAIRQLIKNNPEKKRYFFVIDSSNGLKRKEDLDKSTGEAEKVAGGALLTSDFLGRVSLGMSKFGHVCGIIGQVRTDIKISQYEKGTPKLSNASGGSAADHYPSIFLEFQKRYASDLIGDPNDPKGHWCKVNVIKTDNEKTTTVKYPIKYGSDGKSGSVWKEYEIADLMLQWGFATKSGAWINLSDEIAEEMGVDNSSPIAQGFDKFTEWLESNSEFTEKMYDKFMSLLS